MNRRTLICCVVWGWIGLVHAQVATVHGHVEVAGNGGGRKASLPSTVVWLTPMAGTSGNSLQAPPPGGARLVQKNKTFEPHILVVPVGSVVEFPNRDPFFHNVFSMFEGKRFDLGLYEAGTSRIVHFDRPGVSYIFCNIHPEMSAVVITVTTPLYAISNPAGQLSIANVPYGKYLMHIWSEQRVAENTAPETREVTISDALASLGAIRVPANSGPVQAHKNKYGREYDKPNPDNPIYH
jgi:plastocyanin